MVGGLDIFQSWFAGYSNQYATATAAIYSRIIDRIRQVIEGAFHVRRFRYRLDPVAECPEPVFIN